MIAKFSVCEKGSIKSRPIHVSAEAAVNVNDLIGWGVLFPPSQKDVKNRMVICYMTINLDIALIRVMFEPPGGLFPVIVLPPDSGK